MANVKTRYADVTREAKKALVRAADEAKRSDGFEQEERIFATFRRRAREDVRTLISSGGKSSSHP
jgi:hypothetical protein